MWGACVTGRSADGVVQRDHAGRRAGHRQHRHAPLVRGGGLRRRGGEHSPARAAEVSQLTPHAWYPQFF